jgi:putative transposase
LLVSPKSEHSLPSAMRDVNWRYSRHVNATYDRTGSLWDGRYKACIVDAEDYFFACCRYVETNPLRTGIAQDPETYRWSSYKSNAHGVVNSILTPHPLYLNLGANSAACATAYRELFDQPLPESTVEAIRAATNGGWALGKVLFEARVTRHAGRNMAPRGPGRPWPKKAEQRKHA